MTNQDHVNKCLEIFEQVAAVLKLKNYTILPMQRKDLKNAKSCTVGYINFAQQKIVIDVFTPAKGQPKAYASIIRILAHEAAHIKKPPYRSLYKGHFITRQHYPAFYRQVTKNIKKLKKNKILYPYFEKN